MLALRPRGYSKKIDMSTVDVPLNIIMIYRGYIDYLDYMQKVVKSLQIVHNLDNDSGSHGLLYTCMS